MDNAIKILFIVVCLLYGVYVFVSVDRSTDGFELEKIRKEINTYRVLNGELKEEIAISQSLGYINDEARRMGFVDVEKYIYYSQ